MFYHLIVFASRILGLNAAKEKLEIVSGAALPPFRIFAGGIPRRRRRRNAPCPVVSFALLSGFGLIQEYCTISRILGPVLNFQKFCQQILPHEARKGMETRK